MAGWYGFEALSRVGGNQVNPKCVIAHQSRIQAITKKTASAVII